jgi:hypothetical protein
LNLNSKNMTILLVQFFRTYDLPKQQTQNKI